MQDTWGKSSYSGHNGNCVEARQLDAVQVRDSQDPDGPVVSVTAGAWDRFLARVKAGGTERLTGI